MCATYLLRLWEFYKYFTLRLINKILIIKYALMKMCLLGNNFVKFSIHNVYNFSLLHHDYLYKQIVKYKMMWLKIILYVFNIKYTNFNK